MLLTPYLRWQKGISLISTLSNWIISIYILYQVYFQGIQAVKLGNWIPPFGIILVADLLSAIMVVLSMTISISVLIYSFGNIDKPRERHSYYPLFQFLIMGINGSFLTGDIFNLFVFFEVMLISSYVLLALGGGANQLKESITYLAINVIASAFFLVAVGALYAVAGTLNMADLAQKLAQTSNQGVVIFISFFFLVVFGIKAAIFPLYFWLPDAYPTPPTAISAIFGGLLTKVGVYCLMRVFTLIFIQDPYYTHNLILILSGLTMFLGVLGAIIQNDFKKILSYHIISQVGYMVMGIGLYTRLSLAGSIFYIIHHIIVKSNLFLVSGITERISGTNDLRKMGGLLNYHGFIAFLFLISGLSLAGVPPLSGFFSKLILVMAGIETRNYFIVAVALMVSILTLFSMAKIWSHVFWGEVNGDRDNIVSSKYIDLIFPVVFLALLTVFIGLGSQAVMSLSLKAADQILDPTHYIQAVMRLR
jgi:multicomponent Na+:H+ antiporter subunit D